LINGFGVEDLLFAFVLCSQITILPSAHKRQLLLLHTSPVPLPYPSLSHTSPAKQPAALLAASLSQPGGDDSGGLGVKLADFVAAVVVLGVGEVGIAPLGLAPGPVRRPRLGRPGPPIQPVHELVLS
jgi:hypothetical protein